MHISRLLTSFDSLHPTALKVQGNPWCAVTIWVFLSLSRPLCHVRRRWFVWKQRSKVWWMWSTTSTATFRSSTAARPSSWRTYPTPTWALRTSTEVGSDLRERYRYMFMSVSVDFPACLLTHIPPLLWFYRPLIILATNKLATNISW